MAVDVGYQGDSRVSCSTGLSVICARDLQGYQSSKYLEWLRRQPV